MLEAALPVGSVIADTLKKFFNDCQTRLEDNESWGRDAFQTDRDQFMNLLRQNLHMGQCKACNGIGHTVADGCGLNNRLDSRLKKLDGGYKSMWGCIKNHKSNPGAKKKGLQKKITK